MWCLLMENRLLKQEGKQQKAIATQDSFTSAQRSFSKLEWTFNRARVRDQVAAFANTIEITRTAVPQINSAANS